MHGACDVYGHQHAASMSTQATLENVTDLQPSSLNFTYFVKVQCSSCREVHPKPVGVSRSVRPKR